MKLRKLEIKDAPLMLEWMHDEDVVHYLHADFQSKTLEDAESFIRNSWNDTDNLNLAVVSDSDEYFGTVSLKNIDYVNSNAEFAITVRKEAMGHGYSWYGMESIISRAFDELKLKSVYWCVSKVNDRAIHFYNKHKFRLVTDIAEDIKNKYDNADMLNWYCVFASDNFKRLKTVSDCKVINIKTIATEDSGGLSVFEANKDIDFQIKRLYYITKVPEGIRRGYHAHKKLKQLLFCPYGSIQLTLDNGVKREEITLDDSSVGVIIDKPVWREMLWLQKDSVLCVAASEYYDVEDYIRDYGDFKKYVSDSDIY